MTAARLPEIGPAEMRRMIGDIFPQFAELPATQLTAFGTDHLLFRVGDRALARLPANADAARTVTSQARWLERFKTLPLQVPQTLATAPSCELWPHPWSMVEWIEGLDAATAEPADWSEAAERLGRFVAALRRCDPAGGALSGPKNAWRGAPLAALDGWMRAAISSIADWYDPAQLSALWAEALAAPVWNGPPVWVHGDLHAGNLLVRDGRLVAVIDFGLLSLGDPACDLAPAWTFFPAEQRIVFRRAAGLDEAAWRRGRGWALYAGAIALAHHGATNPQLAAMGRKAVSAVLAEE
jgi:aminoglycoside phosphotransferase (APT) family kinase protein